MPDMVTRSLWYRPTEGCGGFVWREAWLESDLVEGWELVDENGVERRGSRHVEDAPPTCDWLSMEDGNVESSGGVEWYNPWCQRRLLMSELAALGDPEVCEHGRRSGRHGRICSECTLKWCIGEGADTRTRPLSAPVIAVAPDVLKERIIGFARKWGSLVHGTDILTSGDQGVFTQGVEYGFWRTEISRARRYLKAHAVLLRLDEELGAVSKDSESEIEFRPRDFAERLAHGRYGGGGLEYRVSILGDTKTLSSPRDPCPEIEAAFADGERSGMRAMMQTYMTRLLNEALAEHVLVGARVAPDAGSPGAAARLIIEPRGLAGIIWWQAGELLNCPDRFAVCPWCGHVFALKHGRQKYCCSAHSNAHSRQCKGK